MTWRLVLAYDGTDFEGWQAQAGARPARTVQGVLEQALTVLAGDGERVVVTGAGRTDAGVHAEGQVASFVLPRPFTPPRLQAALNGLLPHDVRALQADIVAGDFHARRKAESKVYRYVVDLAPVQLPTRRRYAAHEPNALDLDAVRAAAAVYVGRHDFAAVGSAGSSVKTTVRTIRRSVVVVQDTALVYEVEADGFLRKMVRSLVGGLLAAGRGRVTAQDLALKLRAGDRAQWPAPADARGLTLVSVAYSD